MFWSRCCPSAAVSLHSAGFHVKISGSNSAFYLRPGQKTLLLENMIGRGDHALDSKINKSVNLGFPGKNRLASDFLRRNVALLGNFAPTLPAGVQANSVRSIRRFRPVGAFAGIKSEKFATTTSCWSLPGNGQRCARDSELYQSRYILKNSATERFFNPLVVNRVALLRRMFHAQIVLISELVAHENHRYANGGKKTSEGEHSKPLTPFDGRTITASRLNTHKPVGARVDGSTRKGH
jgi:hypothetical protein